jgi:preprotein translocase subunit SecY
LGFLDIFGGGALGRLSILALGIMPYITSSIVFQILTIAFPYLRIAARRRIWAPQNGAMDTLGDNGLTMLQASVATSAFQKLGVIPVERAISWKPC